MKDGIKVVIYVDDTFEVVSMKASFSIDITFFGITKITSKTMLIMASIAVILEGTCVAWADYQATSTINATKMPSDYTKVVGN